MGLALLNLWRLYGRLLVGRPRGKTLGDGSSGGVFQGVSLVSLTFWQNGRFEETDSVDFF